VKNTTKPPQKSKPFCRKIYTKRIDELFVFLFTGKSSAIPGYFAPVETESKREMLPECKEWIWGTRTKMGNASHIH